MTARKNKEDALRESEERYRGLFNTMDQGHCVIEMVFDKRDKPVNYRFLEINDAFEKQTAMINVVGKLVNDLVPNLEKYWYETHGTISKTCRMRSFIDDSMLSGKT